MGFLHPNKISLVSSIIVILHNCLTVATILFYSITNRAFCVKINTSTCQLWPERKSMMSKAPQEMLHFPWHKHPQSSSLICSHVCEEEPITLFTILAIIFYSHLVSKFDRKLTCFVKVPSYMILCIPLPKGFSEYWLHPHGKKSR